MKADITEIRKKIGQKRILYPMVLVLMLLPFLYFLNGVQVEAYRHPEENTESRAAFSAPGTADVWYETGRSVREPEHIEKRSVTTEMETFVDTEAPAVSWRETWESALDRCSRRQSCQVGDGWGLRAPPVLV